MRFADPLFLLLAVVPFLMVFAGRRNRVLIFSDLSSLKQFSSGSVFEFLRKTVPILIWLLLVVGMARPQAGRTLVKNDSEGIDIILAVDTSGSMRAMDFVLDNQRVDRLTMVKSVVSQFVEKRANDRLGLVVFGEQAFLQCPLTLDHQVVQDFLSGLVIGMAGDATAIGSAIGVSVNRIRELEAQSKVVILLTDGRQTAGQLTPEKAAEIAKKFGVKIYTVGAGSRGRAPIANGGLFGGYVQSDLDEDTLKRVADITGGKYFRATDADSLAKVYETIDKLETREIQIEEYVEYKELFHFAVAPAGVLFLLYLLIFRVFFRVIP